MELAFPVASLLAPILTGLIYLQVGVTGVIAVDLGTFVIAAAVVGALPLPQPAASAEAVAARGRLWDDLAGGLRFLRQRPPLLIFLLYLSFINFLLNGPLELQIPFLVALTGSEARVTIGLTASSLGAVAGAALVAVAGRYRPRWRLILLGSLLCGLMFLVLGTARTLPLAAVALFLVILPLPASGALYVSLLQVKVPPGLQGRVFGLDSQLALLGSTVSFLLVGPLVDRVIQPIVGTPAWRLVTPLLGTGPAAGIGLVLVVTGLLILAPTILVFSLPSIRRMESDLPDDPP